jgi:hypothetical protein
MVKKSFQDAYRLSKTGASSTHRFEFAEAELYGEKSRHDYCMYHANLLWLGLLYVSKQAYHESLPILYSSNIFSILGGTAMGHDPVLTFEKFALSMELHGQSIRNMHLDLDLSQFNNCTRWTEVLTPEYVALFAGLQELHLTLILPDHYSNQEQYFYMRAHEYLDYKKYPTMWPDPSGVLRSLILSFRQHQLQSQRTTCLIMGGGCGPISASLPLPYRWDVNDHRKLAEAVRKNILDHRPRPLFAGDTEIACDG